MVSGLVNAAELEVAVEKKSGFIQGLVMGDDDVLVLAGFSVSDRVVVEGLFVFDLPVQVVEISVDHGTEGGGHDQGQDFAFGDEFLSSKIGKGGKGQEKIHPGR